MHRATPKNTAFRSYCAGGARTTIHQADDSKLMQEMGGNVMKAEQRTKIESPQNYGFTSVVMDADKGQGGEVSGCAEGFMQFPGGNRSFAVCGVMDDRRHRLKNLEKGDTAMFRTKDDKQQLHMTQDGGFWSAPQDKTARMQLVAKGQDSGSSGGQGGQGGQSQATGQQSVYQGGQKSDFFFHLTQDGATASGKNVYLRTGSSFGDETSNNPSTAAAARARSRDERRARPEQFDQTNNVLAHAAEDLNMYLGAKKGDASFLRVMLEDGTVAENVWGKVGGGSGSGGGGGGGAVSSASPPLNIDSLKNMTLAQAAPLMTNSSGELGLNIAAPLFIDGSGNLSSLPGPQGATGPGGPVGPLGATGATGFVGPQGASGLQGSSGPAGPAGAAGASGATGPAGAAGASGATGAVYGGTSATAVTIGTGSQNFATQTGLAYSVGARVRASSRAAPTSFMEGLVSAYSGGLLTVNVDLTGGSGTASDWNLNLAGVPGATGPLGPAGASGATGPTGGVGAAGASGATGPVGPAGASGATGPTGPSGGVGASGATGPAAATVPNCGRLAVTGNTTVNFYPYNGDLVKINGAIYNIPSGGVVGPNTGTYVNGVAGQSLAANSLYYVYVFYTGSALALNFDNRSFGGGNHGRSGTTGNVGVEVLNTPGGDAFTLVGMVWTTSGGGFSDNGQFRGCLSWFNRQSRNIGISFNNNAATGVNGAYTSLLGSTTAPILLNWTDEVVHFGLDSQCSCTATGSIAVSFDSTSGNVMQNQYIYASSTFIFPTTIVGFYPPAEGAHSYFVIGCGSVTASAGTLQMNNCTLWMTTRG
jgi:phage gp45-like